ncbi:MAG: mechanosensitive ion channel family protein [Chthonomonadaceae bacterium]|nr:mechanosensitive ion channel family protein [Chthonomonadaceae bacterium]
MSPALRFLLASAACLLAAGARAQLPMPPIGGGSPNQVPERLSNPRATVRTFLEAMNESRTKDAAETLDLSSVNLVLRDTEGPRLAKMLFDVLNRTIYVDLELIPDKQGGDAYTLVRPKDPAGRVVGAIELARLDSGAWKFSRATVEALPAMWEAVRDRPTIAGLKEIDARSVDPGEWLRSQVPEPWRAKSFWLEHWQWMMLGALVLASVALHLLTRLLLAGVLRVRYRIVGARLSDSVRRGLRRSIGWILTASMLLLSVPYLNLPELLGAALILGSRVLQFATAIWMLFAIWDAVMEAFSNRATQFMQRADAVLIPIASKFGKFVILAAGLILFAASMGINLAGIVAGIGVGGLVLALAAKDSVENVFGSLTILFDMPFGIGDWVRIGEIDGTVEEINLRSTRIRTFEDSVITVPNSNMIKASVENFGVRRYRRLKMAIALTYSTPPEKIEEFCAGIREMIANHPKTRKDKYHVEMNAMNASSLDVLLYMFFETDLYAEELALRGAFLLDIARYAETIGVEFAFPSRSVYIQSSPPSAATGD